MTRKNYELIARSIRAARLAHAGSDIEELAINCVVEQLDDALADENPRFDRERFRAACRGGADRIAKVANEVEADGWPSVAADLREGRSPEAVLEAVREIVRQFELDDATAANTVAALESLVKEANRW